jgi:AcrR family transcriptional regulator
MTVSVGDAPVFGTVSRVAGRDIEVLPRRPHTSVREELRASQRGRLICAIADCVAEKGYAATSVADIIERAGVSRRTFYGHFEDKEACFLAAYDVGAEAIFEAMVASLEGVEGWEQILDAVLSTWLEFLQADLAFTRAYMIEFWGAGDAARERWEKRRDRTAGLLKALHGLIREEDPSVVPVSDTVIAAVVGGINRVMISHVLARKSESLITLKPELLRFIKLTLASHEDA